MKKYDRNKLKLLSAQTLKDTFGNLVSDRLIVRSAESPYIIEKFNDIDFERFDDLSIIIKEIKSRIKRK